jgi:hypothetical protein
MKTIIAAMAVGTTITMVSCSRDQTAGTTAKAGETPTQPETRTLTTPEAEHAETFTDIIGVRELRDGRVLMVDSRERTVQILDFQRGGSTRVGRSGKGPGEYTLPVAVIPLAGDSSGIVDEVNRRILVILPDGTTGGVIRLSGFGGDGYASLPRSADIYGQVYARVADHDRGVSSDSAPILRWTPGQDRADTVAWARLQATTVTSRMMGKAHGIFVRVDPFKAQDQWAVSLDGRVAVADPTTYQIRWTDPAGARSVSPPIAFTPVPFTEAHKEEWRAAQRRDVAVMVDGDNGTVTTRPVRKVEEPPWPESLPPFLHGALRFAPDGNLWVKRTGPADMAPTYDVIDAQGRVIQKVVFPANTRLIGFGRNGAIYVVRLDDDDLEHLQRYRLR